MLVLLLIVVIAALFCYCLRLRLELKRERASTEALRWALLRSKLQQAGMLPKDEDWPEYL